jgi:hypothetical protein
MVLIMEKHQWKSILSCLGVLEILCQFYNLEHNDMRRIDNDREIQF